MWVTGQSQRAAASCPGRWLHLPCGAWKKWQLELLGEGGYQLDMQMFTDMLL